MMYLQIIQIFILLILLVLIILLYKNSPKIESYCNCFGAQYDGSNLLTDPNKPICSQDTTKPLYPSGGCASYDPSMISQEYENGKLSPKGV